MSSIYYCHLGKEKNKGVSRSHFWVPSIHFGAYKEEPTLVVTPKTKYYRSSPVWVESKVYLYGTIEDAGGKDKVEFDRLVHKSSSSFAGIDADAYVRELRGAYEFFGELPF